MTSISLWVYDDILASGVSGPADIFTAANHLMAQRPSGGGHEVDPITWRIESPDGRTIRTASGQSIQVDGKIDPGASREAVLLTAPFVGDMDRFLQRRDLIDLLARAARRTHERGAYVATYCTGAYLLAEAGLLDARPATTHWRRAEDFGRRYPRVALRAQEILTEQDRILCGGAVTSFQALALRLVELLRGPDLMKAVAKMMLIDLNRVSQLSYASLKREYAHIDPLVARAQALMEAQITETFSLPRLASQLSVSERTLHRRFKKATDRSPLGYLQELRVELAKRLLETSQIGLERIGERVGYGDLGAFREIFKRQTGLSPRDYRRHFAGV